MPVGGPFTQRVGPNLKILGVDPSGDLLAPENYTVPGSNPIFGNPQTVGNVTVATENLYTEQTFTYRAQVNGVLEVTNFTLYRSFQLAATVAYTATEYPPKSDAFLFTAQVHTIGCAYTVLRITGNSTIPSMKPGNVTMVDAVSRVSPAGTNAPHTNGGIGTFSNFNLSCWSGTSGDTAIWGNVKVNAMSNFQVQVVFLNDTKTVNGTKYYRIPSLQIYANTTFSHVLNESGVGVGQLYQTDPAMVVTAHPLIDAYLISRSKGTGFLNENHHWKTWQLTVLISSCVIAGGAIVGVIVYCKLKRPSSETSRGYSRVEPDV